MKLSSFSIILVFVVMMIIGASMIPLIEISDKPVMRYEKNIMVRVGWPNIPANIVEQKVTCPLEGVLSSVDGVQNVYSVSSFGESSIDVILKPDANVSSVKLAVSSIIRQTYNKLPEGVWYPWIGGGKEKRRNDNESKLLLTYQIHSSMNPEILRDYLEKTYALPVRNIEGVNKVEVVGTVEHEIEITFNPEVILNYHLNINEISEMIRNYLGMDHVVGSVIRDHGNGGRTITMHLISDNDILKIKEIPITTKNEKIIYLNDLVKVRTLTKKPKSYFRVNGQNTAYMNIYVLANSNLIPLSFKIQNLVNEIESCSLGQINKEISFDGAKSQREELFTMITRTLYSLLLLLFFVWVTNRSLKNLFIVSVSLIANIFISFIGYVIFEVQLNIYSLVGITVSLGLIIDATIMMTDHYSYYRNKKAFLAIMAALITSIGSLLIIFFLPQETKDFLGDFGWVIVINLTTALFVALFFVPALIDKLKYYPRKNTNRKLRRLVFWNKIYYIYIKYACHYKKICYAIMILAFGIPVFALPGGTGDCDDSTWDDSIELPWYEKVYNKTLGSDFFIENLKEPLSYILGGSITFFANAMNNIENINTENKQEKLNIEGTIPAKMDLEKLNEKTILLENYLDTFSIVEKYVTHIQNNTAKITVSFNDNIKSTKMLLDFEEEIRKKAFSIGGVSWSLSGISPSGYSNDISSVTRNYTIELRGYNYDRLNLYAKEICDTISKNNMVSDIAVEVPGYENKENNYFVDYHSDKMTLYNITPNSLYSSLSKIQNSNYLGKTTDSSYLDIWLRPYSTFDMWKMMNSQINISGNNINIKNVSDITLKNINNEIPRIEQEYILKVSFNNIGNPILANDYIDNIVKLFNKKMELGFRCNRSAFFNRQLNENNWWAILLVVVIIYVICVIQFESFKIAIMIISMIPISLIGTFLSFALTKIPFGEGGYASLIMLCGITVNSALYLLSHFIYLIKQSKYSNRNTINTYIYAFNQKITPIMLTILSTVLGLFPFFIDGTNDLFWISFATGLSGGMIFSVIALIFVLPIITCTLKYIHV